MPMLASLNDARDYFEQLPAQLEVYFDEAYQRAFDRLISAFQGILELVDLGVGGRLPRPRFGVRGA